MTDKESLSGAGCYLHRERPELAKTTVSPICISIDHAPLSYPSLIVGIVQTTVGAHRGAWRLLSRDANGFISSIFVRRSTIIDGEFD